MPSEPNRLAADGVPPAPPRALSWRLNAVLFVATAASVFGTRFVAEAALADGLRVALVYAGQFTGALLAILLAHEFGHYVAARIHGVEASLPFFIPVPMLSPFGTMGAVIRMRSLIPTRRALFDIGAAGPLAGLALALPLYAWGVAHSHFGPTSAAAGGMELGESLLSRLLDHLFAPPVPEGAELWLSPIALAAWFGMFMTMLNLLPVGQLDGGHVAFALFGPKQNRVAQWAHRSMLAFFFVSVFGFVERDVENGIGLLHIGRAVNNSVFWLVTFEALAVLGSVSNKDAGKDGSASGGPAPLDARTRIFATIWLALLAGMNQESASGLMWTAWFLGLGLLLAMEVRSGVLRDATTLLDHPPTGAQPLSRGRAIVAAVTLAFFPALFMPTPISV
jgi:membrane-associated protease RseP (regulator of RpoE activity)